MANNLVIVESPAKAKTIEKFLGTGFVVKSSYGHIRDLAKAGKGIDTKNNFEMQYLISDDKQKVVNELMKAVSKADMVWLASDEDREGEAIAWHLKETLKLSDDKTKRIVFNEITKTAILNAINNPRTIDMNLVNAQQARRALDRLVGFEISPILWRKIKPALSAGRVQSVAVRLIVEREDEIRKFKSKSYFRVVAIFDIPNSNKTLKAELSQRFDKEEDAYNFLEACQNRATFVVNSVEKKAAKRSPAPPFTTSTLQQEAGRKLGFPVARTMQVAQQLYENGFITYMRTDSVNLSDLALSMAKEEITKLYGRKYLKTRKYHTKTKGAQEAHEAIRPTNMANTTISGDPSQRRLYELIWKRTIASQMSDAELEKTNMSIDISTRNEKFTATGEVVLFDGFLKLYMESTDDEQDEQTENVLPPLSQGMQLAMNKCEATERFTQHPARYTEASLVKKMEDLGIGRPSTYASIISTIQQREYVVKEDRDGTSREYITLTLSKNHIKHSVAKEKTGYEKGKLFPTDIGSIVNSFLLQHFENIMDYNFTAIVEKDFDDIALGHKEWKNVIADFYSPFHENVERTNETSQRASGEHLLGIDPKTGHNVYAKIGRYGAMVQIGESNTDEKPSFAALKKGQSIDTITLEEALELFALPRMVGTLEGIDMTVAIGRFGPYVRHDGKFYSLDKTDDPYTITDKRCIEIIIKKRKENEEKEKLMALLPKTIGEQEGEAITSNIGRFGPYLSYKGKNYKLPKGTNPLEVTIDDAMAIINKPKTTKKK
ncbi:MAG: type I DNA topoisomerase [Bacteroidales bacterium]|nr:type I DNA topoisomerase [Bacteroidales bacterium]